MAGEIGRRGFLAGLASVAAAAVGARLPVPAPLPATPPLYEGAIGVYQSVIFRGVESIDLRAVALDNLREWWAHRPSDEFCSIVTEGNVLTPDLARRFIDVARQMVEEGSHGR